MNLRFAEGSDVKTSSLILGKLALIANKAIREAVKGSAFFGVFDGFTILYEVKHAELRFSANAGVDSIHNIFRILFLFSITSFHIII